MKQEKLLKSYSKSYGGELSKTRKGRERGRPLSTKHSIHLVMRSSHAKGSWSFKNSKNEKKIKQILFKFSKRYGVRIHSMANVGNHLHLHIKLGNLHTYKPFIRAISSAIMMTVTGINRWTRKRPNSRQQEVIEGRFWDYRPFTRIVMGLKGFLTLRDYIGLNQLEGFGYKRGMAKWMMAVVRTNSS